MPARQSVILIILCLSLLALACEDRGNSMIAGPGQGYPVGYDYQGFDGGGRLAVAGSLVLTQIDSSSVSGSWILMSVSSDVQLGPQTGTGRLAGSTRGEAISMNLNPDWVDNNVVLQGVIDRDRISGTWMWITFAGATAKGTFIANKKPAGTKLD